MARLLVGLISLLLLTGLGACRGSESTSPGEQSATTSAVSAGAQNPSPGEADASTPEPNIGFLPDPPSSADDVRLRLANVTGGYEVAWERNGQLIEDVHGDRLPKGRLVRDDLLTARVRFEGGEVTADTRVINSPPEMLAINFADARIHRGVDIVLEPVAFDADGDPVSFSYRWWLNGEELHGQASERLAGDLFSKGDRIAVQVTPADAFAEGKPFTGREFVIPGAPPKFVSEPPLNFQSLVYQYHAQAEDADGDEVRYALSEAPEGMSLDEASGRINWKLSGVAPGEYRIRIRAVDSDGMEAFQEYTLNLSVAEQEG